jgi:hypothetical protein
MLAYVTDEMMLEHIEALRLCFELEAEDKGYSVHDLTSIRNRVIEENGGSKYDCDWSEPEEKIAFDYFYCLEQYQRFDGEGDLSNSIRLRLYWFATKNDHVKKRWEQANRISRKKDGYTRLDPINFFNKQMIKDKAWKFKYDPYKTRRPK